MLTTSILSIGQRVKEAIAIWFQRFRPIAQMRRSLREEVMTAGCLRMDKKNGPTGEAISLSVTQAHV
jgi:hypothetical protein